MSVDLILVPQGAEYAAVTNGLRTSIINPPQVVAIPVGIHALHYLEHSPLIRELGQISPWQNKNILVMGLGGSLRAQANIGDIVIPKSLDFAICGTSPKADSRDQGEDDSNLKPIKDRTSMKQSLSHCWLEPSFTRALQETLINGLAEAPAPPKIIVSHGVTSNRIIITAQEKQRLGHIYDADVVDMEGVHICDFFHQKGARVGIVRAISDGCATDIPDLNVALDEAGNLNFKAMIWQFLRRPKAAANLIQGSLKGLKCLELISGFCASLTL
ncbi:MAG: hypothetical protein AAGD25_34670 [Cyanobacteria bacterium P01_F01_bin.150]